MFGIKLLCVLWFEEEKKEYSMTSDMLWDKVL